MENAEGRAALSTTLEGISVTKDELKQEAARLGVKVKESFMDDVLENCIILAIGLICGVAIAKMFF